MKTIRNTLAIIAIASAAMTAHAKSAAAGNVCQNDMVAVKVTKIVEDKVTKKVEVTLNDVQTNAYVDRRTFVKNVESHNSYLASAKLGQVVCHTKLPDYLEVMSQAF